MANAPVRYNERSWAIDVISYINQISNGNDRIQRASGELTVSTHSQNLFPDILLFGDQSHGNILQGWELKMPDTAIDDQDFISNAEKKARGLGLNSFLVYNATQANLYIRNDSSDNYRLHDEPLFINDNITCREDVAYRPEIWQDAVRLIINKLNYFLSTGMISGVSPDVLFSDTAIIGQLLSCQAEVKSFIEQKARQNNRIDARIKLWWRHVKKEYPGENSPSGPLAYCILFRWFNRFVFSNILKAYNLPLSQLSNITTETSVDEAISIFAEISQQRNYWNIFGRADFDDLMPERAWNFLVSLNDFFEKLEFANIEHSVLQIILKSSVLSSIKKAAGLYVTPQNLARLLVLLSLSDRDGFAIDPFCGTGTIVKSILEVKSDNHIPVRDTLRSTWGSDKFAFPVQIATLSISLPEITNEPLRIFTSDAFDIQTSQTKNFINPANGQNVHIQVPLFSSIISNLPFVRFEDVAELNPIVKQQINDFYAEHSISDECRLSTKSDLYSYIPFLLYNLLQEGGKFGVIVSNSWLSNEAGQKFRQLLRRFYDIDYVVVSANGRWFSEAEVVTSILVLSKKTDLNCDDNNIIFATTGVNLEQANIDNISTDILSANPDSNLITVKSRSQSNIHEIDALNIGWTSCFTDVEWLLRNTDKFKLLNNYSDIIRGERWGRNSFFYPSVNAQQNIEDLYLFPLFKSLSGNRRLIANLDPSRRVFCCPYSRETLKQLNHTGTLNWIDQNTKANDSENWYIKNNSAMQREPVFLIQINPDKLLYTARFNEEAIIDQRSVIISPDNNTDLDLLHGMLNSTISMFFIEAIGFGRGLGVLDINKNKIESGFRIPDLELISEDDKNRIKQAFIPLCQRDVLEVDQEILQEDRQQFDSIVLNSIGIDDNIRTDIYHSLLSLYKIRKSVA